MKNHNEKIITTLTTMLNLYINNLNYKERSFELIINDQSTFLTKQNTLKAQMAGAHNVIDNLIVFIRGEKYSLPKNSKIILKKIFSYCSNHIDSLEKPVLFEKTCSSNLSNPESEIENKRIDLKKQINEVGLFLKEKNII